MERQKPNIGIVVLAISVLVLINASNFPVGFSGSSAQTPVMSADTTEQNPLKQPRLDKGSHNTLPGVPPSNDSKMVVKPDVPPNPEAVVTPPVVDPEMVVDPITRQPMNEEKLERLTPEDLEENAPGERQREFQNK